MGHSLTNFSPKLEPQIGLGEKLKLCILRKSMSKINKSLFYHNIIIIHVVPFLLAFPENASQVIFPFKK